MTIYDDSGNIFAKILRGELPAHKIYEDEATFAFMDIMPRGDGHSLVIPKKPSRNILDVDSENLAAVMDTVRKVARASVSAFGARWGDDPAVQRAGRRPGGVPPACPHHSPLRGRWD
jgi:histidine triad (HIT) family protein